MTAIVSEQPRPTPPVDLPQIPGYEIREILGQGGQGTVYRARQKSLHRVVAIKVLSPKHADSKFLKQRFLAEARLQSKLHHPNILQGIDVKEHEGLWYFVMEFVSGTDAQVLMTQRGALPEREVLKIAQQVAEALTYAHDHGIVHGDIKPENIVIAADGSVKMIDFGIARLAREDSQKDKIEGTREFMAPEVKSGKTKGDIRSDMYSLGVTLYELLTASLPPIAKGTDKAGPDPKEREPKIGLSTAALVKKLLAVDPTQRPESPQALTKALGKAAAGAPVQKVIGNTPAPRPSRRTVAARVAFAALVLGGAIALYVASQPDKRPTPDETGGARKVAPHPEPPRTDPRPPRAEPEKPAPPKSEPPTSTPPKPDPITTETKPPKSAPPSLEFSPRSVQVLEGETFTIRVTAANLPVALKPLIKVLDAEGRDISASVNMPAVKRDPTDHTTVNLTWTAPYWPLHESQTVAILVSQPPLQEKVWIGIDDKNRSPDPRTDAVGPIVLKEGGDPITVTLDPGDPDNDDTSAAVQETPEGIEASLVGNKLILRAKDRPGQQGDTELFVSIYVEDDVGGAAKLSVPILIADIDHPIKVTWDLGNSSFQVIPAESADEATLLRGSPSPGLNARLTITDPDIPDARFTVALHNHERVSGLSLKAADNGSAQVRWRGSTSDSWGPRPFTLVASAPGRPEQTLRCRLQVVRRIHPGSETSNAPLDRALHWLRRHQLEDGSFPVLEADYKRFSEDPADGGNGHNQHRAGLTALSVIAALRAGDASPWVIRAARYLVGKQDSEGKIGDPSQHWIYNHVLASEALSLAAHLLGNEEFRMPARKATWLINAARNTGAAAGWRYGLKPGDSDTSVTVWALRALLAAKMAGIQVEDDTLRGGMAFIQAMMGKDGRIGYEKQGAPTNRTGARIDRFLPQLSESMTAAGTSVLLYSPMLKANDQRLQKARRIVIGCPPTFTFKSRSGAVLLEKLSYGEKRKINRLSTLDFYYWQHATALFRAWRLTRGKTIHRASDWKNLPSLLGSHQRKSGDARGSWDPEDPFSAEGGRTYATAILALALANLEFTAAMVGE